MKKQLNKIIVVLITIAIGLMGKNISASENVKLTPWVFYQAGDMASATGMGLYNSASTTAGEVLDSSKFPQNGERSVVTEKVADGFTVDIKDNGWDCIWEEDICNPWMLTVRMNTVKIEQGHDYMIMFKAYASKGKYVYFTIGSEYDGEPQLRNQDQLLVLNTTEKLYTYTFTNWAGSKTLDIWFMLGAFNGTLNYSGNSIADKMIYGRETSWDGTVTVSDFKIVDLGQNIEYISESPTPRETEETTNNIIRENGSSLQSSMNRKEKRTQNIVATAKTVSYKSKPFLLNATTDGDGRLSYNSSNNKVVSVSSIGKVTVKGYGKAIITIAASETNMYKGAVKKIAITVVPEKMKISKVSSPIARRISISWKKDKTVTGYQMLLSEKKNFKSKTFKRVFKSKMSKTYVTGLTNKKVYYVKIRAYKKVGKKKYYGKWSKIKSVRVQ